jgi:hypothetical protein
MVLSRGRLTVLWFAIVALTLVRKTMFDELELAAAEISHASALSTVAFALSTMAASDASIETMMAKIDDLVAGELGPESCLD